MYPYGTALEITPQDNFYFSGNLVGPLNKLFSIFIKCSSTSNDCFGYFFLCYYHFVAPPQIKEKGSNIAKVEASVGTSVVLSCHVTGNPQPWILWQRDGQTLQNGTILSDLIIPGVLANMTGLYTCIAGNQAGIDKYQVLLFVTSCGHSGDITHLAQGKFTPRRLCFNICRTFTF